MPVQRTSFANNHAADGFLLRVTIRVFCCLAVVVLATDVCLADESSWRYKVDDGAFAAVTDGPGEFLVYLSEQADLSHATSLAEKSLKGRYVVDSLRSVAARTQRPIVTDLEAAGVTHRTFWVANLIWVDGGAQVLEELARRDDVARIRANPRVRLVEPTRSAQSDQARTTRSIEWNVALVGAPDVWDFGNIGQGAVVGGIDTGVDWEHPAIIQQYRGYDGFQVDHDYNWHDAIHTPDSICGADSPIPCDDHGHGTHTVGTAVGDDGGANQIGVAPGAQWIGCRCMEEGFGTPARYIECLEWMMAPYPVGGGEGEPTLAPDVINNSWSCPEDEGCSWDTLQPVIENVRAAGIVVVVSAGNSGPECGSVNRPPAIYDAAYSVGATDDEDAIKSFSARGPVTVDGSDRPKPDICAPGSGVRSCLPDGEYDDWSGTSMAAPHVAGLVALLVAADPELAGDVDAIEALVNDTALALYDDECGGDLPNNVFGHGRIDALAAWHLVVTGVEEPVVSSLPPAVQLLPAVPNPFNPRTTIRFELPGPSAVDLKVYDAAGRLVRSLIDGVELAAGRHETAWNGQDDAGRLVAAGVYFCRLETPADRRIRRMSLVK